VPGDEQVVGSYTSIYARPIEEQEAERYNSYRTCAARKFVPLPKVVPAPNLYIISTLKSLICVTAAPSKGTNFLATRVGSGLEAHCVIRSPGIFR
jgi:hypothetical protein